jgi:ABC-type glycerol-3-phosphate transport system substrate-binding protein
MRSSAITTLIAALGLSVVGAAAALAGEYRGSLDGVDTNKNTITVMGVTIQANGYPIANLDPTQNYVVSWEKQGSQNVLLNIQPDESGGTSHK